MRLRSVSLTLAISVCEAWTATDIQALIGTLCKQAQHHGGKHKPPPCKHRRLNYAPSHPSSSTTTTTTTKATTQQQHQQHQQPQQEHTRTPPDEARGTLDSVSRCSLTASTPPKGGRLTTNTLTRCHKSTRPHGAKKTPHCCSRPLGMASSLSSSPPVIC